MSLALATRPRTDQPVTPLERLELLCDHGSLQLIRSEVTSPVMGAKARMGDGVLGGSGTVDGRPVFCYAQDSSFAGGSLGEQHANTIGRVLELAGRGRAPVIGFVSSGGARMQEGIAALGGYGRIFRRTVQLSGRVPQISIVTGLSAGGGAYSPALTDWVMMTEESSMFLTGPGVVREALGEDVDAAQLGGTRVHGRNGVCHFVAQDDFDAARLARSCSATCRATAATRCRSRRRPAGGGDLATIVPEESRRVYDVRDVIAGIVDGGELLEISAGWARNLVTGMARIDGRPVGVIANQPRYLGGVLDAASSEKGARFVSKCDAFGIPLLVLVDTPGLHAGHPPGGRRRDPPRRHPRARLRPGDRAAGDADPPQGLRRRLHHDELQGPRRRLRVRLAGAPRSASWAPSPPSGSSTAGSWPPPRTPRPSASGWPRITPRRSCARRSPPATGYVDELISPAETRGRLVWALHSLGGAA